MDSLGPTSSTSHANEKPSVHAKLKLCTADGLEPAIDRDFPTPTLTSGQLNVSTPVAPYNYHTRSRRQDHSVRFDIYCLGEECC